MGRVLDGWLQAATWAATPFADKSLNLSRRPLTMLFPSKKFECAESRNILNPIVQTAAIAFPR